MRARVCMNQLFGTNNNTNSFVINRFCFKVREMSLAHFAVVMEEYTNKMVRVKSKMQTTTILIIISSPQEHNLCGWCSHMYAVEKLIRVPTLGQYTTKDQQQHIKRLCNCIIHMCHIYKCVLIMQWYQIRISIQCLRGKNLTGNQEQNQDFSLGGLNDIQYKSPK